MQLTMTDSIIERDNFKFTWHIANLQFHPKEILRTTNFSIPFTEVLWCLLVEIKDPGHASRVNCYLDRVPSQFGPEVIFVNYVLRISKPNGFQRTESFKNVRFSNNDICPKGSTQPKISVGLGNTLFNADLIVECKISMSNGQQYYRKQFNPKKLFSLSEDISYLFREGLFSDFTLHSKEFVFNTHKAILKARLPKLAGLLNINFKKDLKADVTILPCVMKSLLHYAYSGILLVENLKDLQELFKVTDVLELRDLRQLMFSTASNYVARTTINIQRKSFSWIINILNCNSGTELAFVIVPLGLKYTTFLTISCQIKEVGTKQLLGFSFQFPSLTHQYPISLNCSLEIIGTDSRLIWCEEFHHLFTSEAIWENNFISKDFLLGYINRLGFNEYSVTFRLIIDLCNGESEFQIAETSAEIVSEVPHGSNLEKLSWDLQHIFRTKSFWDVKLITQNKMEITAHRAVLAARSNTFNTLIQQNIAQNNILEIPGFSNDALTFILRYIYEGKISGLNDANFQEFRKAAEYFRLPIAISEIDIWRTLGST